MSRKDSQGHFGWWCACDLFDGGFEATGAALAKLVKGGRR